METQKAELAEKSFKIVDGDISDGYHTFNELYSHRIKLFIGLVKTSGFECLIKEDHYPGWDAVYLMLPSGQVSYHVPNIWRSLLKRYGKVTKEVVYDGHTSGDVLFRIEKFLYEE
jgi:hypothetical protein